MLLNIDYVGAHTVHILRPLDVDPPTTFMRTAQRQIRSAIAANCTRPYWIYWFAQMARTATPLPRNPQPPYW